ncbi:SAM-dependent methyltransferase [Streptomyces sp. NPDC056304]|uniref:SAM-dependent methyltransferase n=1 Tax=Streptomyces sp. NPDC056304 TaxID=3345778 RepID=UPI0035E26E5D
MTVPATPPRSSDLRSPGPADIVTWATSPSSAGISNFFLGGSDHYPADREVARQLAEAAPWFETAVRINRGYNDFAVKRLARQLKICQFLDLGCGLPIAPSSRQLPETGASAAVAVSGAVVVRVDIDPLVGAYARMAAAGSHSEQAFVQADLREITAVLEDPTVNALKDRGPVGVLLHDVLPFITDVEDARAITGALRGWLPPGSAMSVTHATTELQPAQAKKAARILQEARIPYQPRTHGQIQELLAPWQLLQPGLKPTALHDTSHRHALLARHHSGAHAAIAVHPDRSRA